MSLLFTPYKLGRLQLRNRLVISPMCMYSAVNGLIQPWHFAHLGTLAVSGADLVFVEATAVEPIGRITPGCVGLYNDSQERELTNLVKQIRTFSKSALGIQLSHAGRKASCPPGWENQTQISVQDGGWPVVGPSSVAFGPGWVVPEALDVTGMARITQAFVESAQRADRCGFDVLEIHSAHGYLLSSFLSAISNCRTDQYGGNRQSRMAFPLSVMKAVRAVWPIHKAIGCRFNAIELDERGVTVEDGIAFASELKAIGFDYVTMSAGNAVPGRTYPPLVPGYQVDFSDRVRNGAHIPTMAVGMILTAQQAEAILQEGKADLIAIARGAIDNPRWGWHAANELGASEVYPNPFKRGQPEKWPGYKLVHPSNTGN